MSDTVLDARDLSVNRTGTNSSPSSPPPTPHPDTRCHPAAPIPVAQGGAGGQGANCEQVPEQDALCAQRQPGLQRGSWQARWEVTQSPLLAFLSWWKEKMSPVKGEAEERNAGVNQAGHRGRPLGTGQWRMGMSAVELAGSRCVQVCHPPACPVSLS